MVIPWNISELLVAAVSTKAFRFEYYIERLKQDMLQHTQYFNKPKYRTVHGVASNEANKYQKLFDKLCVDGASNERTITGEEIIRREKNVSLMQLAETDSKMGGDEKKSSNHSVGTFS